MTLVGDPRIIFLDEPTTGLDPRSRRTMWQIVREPGRPAASRSSSPPSTWTRPTSSPTGSPCWTRAGSSPRAPPSELKRRIPGGHVRLRFADADELAPPSASSDGATRDDEALALQVPSDGGVAGAARPARPARRAAIEVDELSVHTPDLDDVFFALTGHPTTETGSSDQIHRTASRVHRTAPSKETVR